MTTSDFNSPPAYAMLVPRALEIQPDDTPPPDSLVGEKPSAFGSDTEVFCDIPEDSQLMDLLGERTREAIEYGDPDSRKNGLQALAKTAVRELGLPACLGTYINLDDKITRRALKAELTRQEARGQQAGYANQDMNTWEASLGRIEPLVRLQLSPEQNEQLNNELGIWAEEMKQKALRISDGLGKLREH